MTKGKKRVAKKDRTDEENKLEREVNAIAMQSFEALKVLLEGVISKPIHLLWSE